MRSEHECYWCGLRKGCEDSNRGELIQNMKCLKDRLENGGIILKANELEIIQHATQRETRT